MAENSKWKIPEIAGFRRFGKTIICGKNQEPSVNIEDSGDGEIGEFGSFRSLGESVVPGENREPP